MPSRLDQWHEGEVAMHRALKAPLGMNPTSPGLPRSYGMRAMYSQLIAVGTLDGQSRPWTSVWGGERGSARPVAEDVLALTTRVDKRYDPVYRAFWEEKGQGEEVTRDRVKLMGRMVAGAEVTSEEEMIQVAFHVQESLGNCPKYINKKDIEAVIPQARLISEGLRLPDEAVELIGKADMFFLSSSNGKTMDTNHRGGPQGLVRVMRNDGEGLELVYPEYSGNRLYQSLGNLRVNPLIGICIPDYDTGDAVYVTGTATILVGEEASSLLFHSNLAVKITASASKFVKSSLPFRGPSQERSPYNPPVRYLLAERVDDPAAKLDSTTGITASLVKREELTPTIHVHTFKLESRDPLPRWKAGQHVTINFEEEVGQGYSHMRDDDPQSLNDDYVRTFTVSCPPGDGPDDEVQITARLNGPVTHFLRRHNLRVPLELPVMGFGGKEELHMPTSTSASPGVPEPVFMAGGVGITPLLAQARGVLAGGVPLTLLWTLRGEDLPLAVHAFDKVPGLADVTTLYVTRVDEREHEALLEKVRERGAKVEARRMGGGDVNGLRGGGKKFYLCMGKGLMGEMLKWLDGEEVVWEDFGY
ncbi:hypothetical protein PT974_12034 [Cladobotryum mycophilum]|uniref:FAD-binding FR-type domain-containing protein n=1 Tax=Cladobotryum mycophilum TaxID=491253 RepID=A0ABR0S708_9HYPO